jgi:type I restriction enzyme, S subunit
MSEWRASTWGDEVSLEYGKGIRGYANACGPVRVFGTNGPVGWTNEPLADGPGVILGRKGAYRGVHYSPDPFYVIDTAYYAMAKSPLNMRWLYYAMIYHELGKIDDGSPIPSTTRAAVYPRELLVPPIEEQEAISVVLGSLDDKIEQNRLTGRALDGLARATFKAWFVDFEPVKAKAAGAAGFPGMSRTAFDALPNRLTDSPLGPVPEGWEVGDIGTVAQRIAMGPFGSDIKTDNFVSDGVPVIRGGNLTDGFVDRGFVFLTEAKADQLANANAFPGDIVITHRGTPGQIGLIPSKSRYKRYVVSQSQMFVRPNAAILPSHFLYLFLTSSAGQHELLANRSQTGVPAISRPTTSVKAIPLVLPQRPAVDAFAGFASTLFNARVASEEESQKLAALRDYLLPRLMSGRVRVRPTQEEVRA